MPPNIVARAISFAHLSKVSGKKADDKDEDKKLQEEEDKKDQDTDDGDSKKSQRAEDDTDENKEAAAEDDSDDSDDKKDSKKSKRSKASDDEDDDEASAEDDSDEEMRGNGTAASARRRERARCAAIFSCKEAGRNVELAASLAFDTPLSRQEAISVLKKTPGAATPPRDRSARNPSLGAGGDQSSTSQDSSISRMDKALKKAQGR